jgi:outer membrane biosynthesis protein TonB
MRFLASAAACGFALALVCLAPSCTAQAQTPTMPTAAQGGATEESAQGGGIREDELRQLLVGKTLYLRGGYLDNTLNFDPQGRLKGQSAEGSYTLSVMEIDKVRLTKRRLELEGIRYGLHFVGQLPYEDPSKAFDRVRITPRKKVVKITIEREMAVMPRKKKEGNTAAPSGSASETAVVTPAEATRTLTVALDTVFAQGLDERLMAELPAFWKHYYQAAAARADYRPADPSILRQNTVDQKAVLLNKFEPESNEYAQASGVAGMALYHAVIGIDGKVGEIAVGRPIGFGLDENAVAALRKASFQPAMKDGKPVPVLLDLVVQFRIFSKRTSAATPAEAAGKPEAPVLPGPYSVTGP